MKSSIFAAITVNSLAILASAQIGIIEDPPVYPGVTTITTSVYTPTQTSTTYYPTTTPYEYYPTTTYTTTYTTTTPYGYSTETPSYEKEHEYEYKPEYGQEYPKKEYGYGQEYPKKEYGYGQEYPKKEYGYGQEYPKKEYGYGQETQASQTLRCPNLRFCNRVKGLSAPTFENIGPSGSICVYTQDNTSSCNLSRSGSFCSLQGIFFGPDQVISDAAGNTIVRNC